MPDLTRFWIVRPQRSDAAPASVAFAAAYRVESVAAETASRALGVASTPGRACIATDRAGVEFAAASIRAVLDELAPKHGGAQVLVVASHAHLAELLEHALGVSDAAELEHVRNLVLDWPTRSDPMLRCALIGLDLDWSPPPPPERAARFPGGPGAAASRRQ